VGPIWIETFRYNKWANLHLLDACSDFDENQLQLTAPGTYGTIARTFMHLLSAEQRYIKRFTGEQPRLQSDSDFPGIAELVGHATRTGDELISLAGKLEPDDSYEVEEEDGRFRIHSGVVLIQAIHHGNDHRTHICTILGAHDLHYGQMDVWAYGEATGAIVPLGAG
jgi:uncharacterized damage-inducible protein DinB